MTPARPTPGRKGWLVPALVGVLAALGCEASIDVERPGPARDGNIPTIAETLPDRALYFEALESPIEEGTLASAEELIERCREFYTPGRVAEIETVLPGWGHMASFAHGKTFWHVNVALTLADSGGWNPFGPPTLEAMYEETRAVLRSLPRAPTD